MFWSFKPLLAPRGKTTFQWVLLNNILWMAPDHLARWQLYIIILVIECMYSVDSLSPYLYFTFEEKDQYCCLFNNIYLFILCFVPNENALWLEAIDTIEFSSIWYICTSYFLGKDAHQVNKFNCSRFFNTSL